jgi:hypothetical protein
MSAADYRAAAAPRGRRGSGFQIPPEHRLQIEVVEWLRRALPEARLAVLEVWWTSIDHAAAASALVGKLRKDRGVRAGIPDMLFLYRGRIIFVELKAPDGDASDSQDAVQMADEAAGAWWHQARSNQVSSRRCFI